MTERRVFRGRGGPTDRRLPKQNARRRKPPKQLSTKVTADASSAGAMAVQPPFDGDISLDDKGRVEMPAEDLQNIENDLADICIDKETTDHDVDSRREVILSAFLKEVHHLMCRISRCHTTMQLAATSNTIPQNYEKHVLGAILNCTKEWKAILRRYDSAELGCNTEIHSAATALFSIIQHGLQCGPLSGSKAGYWKRCGSELAGKGYLFLEDIAPTIDAARSMHFTERQTDTLLTWKLNAKKAMNIGEQPSKSTRERIDQAEKVRLQAKRVMEKKRNREVQIDK